jgi:hypothetical protein
MYSIKLNNQMPSVGIASTGNLGLKHGTSSMLISRGVREQWGRWGPADWCGVRGALKGKELDSDVDVPVSHAAQL